MGFKAAVQILQSAEPLKVKLARKCDLLNDSEAWSDQQQLQTIYHQVLVLDLEYALDKKVEQELWTLGFKNHITALQEQARDRKNPRRADCQALLTWCLESASGFYLTLLQELCNTFDLDLSFRQNGAFYGQSKYPDTLERAPTLPQTSSCLYICQYCLVHLGDIARYRNQRKQAENFYKQAILVSPTSGQPYNQLGLLETSQGDRLSTVFHYVRGITVKNPFPATATNLGSIFNSVLEKEEPIKEIQTKIQANEFIALFLRAHALLHNMLNLQEVELSVKSLNLTLTALVGTQSFTGDKLLKMVIINMFAMTHLIGKDFCKIDQLTSEEIKARELILDLMAGFLSGLLLPVYTLKGDESLLDYYALPAIKILLYWIEKKPQVLSETPFTNKLQIWPGFCKLLNLLQVRVKKFNASEFKQVPLTEDREMQGFLPLYDKLKNFDFKAETENFEIIEKSLRAFRIVEFGKWLSDFEINNTKFIIRKDDDNGKNITFEPGCIQPDPTNQLLEEMKSISFTNDGKTKSKEKRCGILKPQGSLEKSREERELMNSTSSNTILEGNGNNSLTQDPYKLKRLRQNVALQSIYKKIEENKQVKFSSETEEKERDNQVKGKPPLKLSTVQQTSISTSTAPFRTQTFNQNHPALSADIQLGEIFNRQNIENNMAGNMVFPPSPTVPFNQQTGQMAFSDMNVSEKMQVGFKNNSQFSNVPFSQGQFNSGVWSNDNKQGGNWWPQNQQSMHQNHQVSQNQQKGNTNKLNTQNKLSSQNQVNPSGQNQMVLQNQFGQNPLGQNQIGLQNSFGQNQMNLQNQMGQNQISLQNPLSLQNQLASKNQMMPQNQVSRQNQTLSQNQQKFVSQNQQMTPRNQQFSNLHQQNNSMFSTNFQMPQQQNQQQQPYPVNGVMVDYSKQQGLFNSSSPWSSVGGNQQQSQGVFNLNSNPMSMRQAMLNEAKPSGGTTNLMNVDSKMPGYSLFNPSSWAPNLPGQLRSGSGENVNPGGQIGQQSFFSPPQSLKQLLEQQNQFNTNGK